MVETEKVCNHKISTATTTSELVQRTKSVGENNNHAKDGGRVGGGGGGTGTRKSYGSKEDFGRWNTIATGNKGNIPNGSVAGEEIEGGKGQRANLERSMSAYYVFSSLPKVVHNVRPKTGYRNNVSRPRGAHDYFNVMWDPHIYRGTTTTLSSSLKQPDTATDLTSSNRDQQDRYRRRRAFLQGSQNTFNTSTNTSSLTPMGGVGAASTTIRSNRYRMTTKVTSRSRTFPPPEGRHQVHVQTEEYLEDLSRDVVRGPDVDAIVQTDPIEDEELLSSPLVNPLTSAEGNVTKGKMLPIVAGVDASTQVLPGELITFDERVQPVVEAVVGKILEQALLETMEEEEIGALKAQQNRFLEKRKEEERELKRLQEQQERISAEKERLKRHLEMQFKQRQLQQLNNQQQQNGESLGGDSNGTGTSGGGGGEDGDDVDVLMLNDTTTMGGGGGGNINGGVMSTAYLLELLPSVLNSLRQEGFLVDDQSGDEVLSSYVPLWQQQPSSNSSKPDEDENSSTSVYNDNNNEDDDGDMMIAGENNDDGDEENCTLDGCQSRRNSLEIKAEATAAGENESGVEVPEPTEEEKDENVDENCDPSETGEEGVELEENAGKQEEVVELVEEEITPTEDAEDTEEKENAEDEEAAVAKESEEAEAVGESEEIEAVQESEEAEPEAVEESEEVEAVEESVEAVVEEENVEAVAQEESVEAAAEEESVEAAAEEESVEAAAEEESVEAVVEEENKETAVEEEADVKVEENEEAENSGEVAAESEESGNPSAVVDPPQEEGEASEGGEMEAAVDEDKKEDAEEELDGEDAIVITPSPDEKEEEGNNNEIVEDQTAKVMEENAVAEAAVVSPEADSPSPPLSSSQKLPNGAIPSVL